MTAIRNDAPTDDPAVCPDRAAWSDFSRARLDERQTEWCEQHLLQCAACQELLELCEEDSDTIVHVLAALPSCGDDEAEFQRMQHELLTKPESISTGDAATESFPSQRIERPLQLGAHLGSYELLELLGQGATGAVYRARHAKLDRPVAIKVLHLGYAGHNPTAVATFQREMRAVGSLDHPHIVRATDAGEEGGRHFLVMEYVPGVDVSRLVRAVGPLRIADACEIARQAALALEFAHAHGLVHRDIKPSNLFLTDLGQVKLLDLGLATGHQEATASEASSPRGTADYMSPEQWTHFETVDGRADLYSLGCTLFRMLTGVAVFPTESNDPLAKMQAHLKQSPPSMRRLRPEIPLGLQKIVLRLLAKKPSDRYLTAREVIEHLEPFTLGAQLPKLALHIRTQCNLAELPDETQPHASAFEKGSRSWSRRKAIGATLAAVPLAWATGWFWRRQPRDIRLQPNVWRSLPFEMNPRAFPLATDVSANATAPSTITPRKPPENWQIAAVHDTLVELGQPVVGRFAFRIAWQVEQAPERVGLFFRYRPRKTNDQLVHPFHAIELVDERDVSTASSMQRLLWSEYTFTETAPDTFRRQSVTLAETQIPPSGEASSELQVTLGVAGIPVVGWNGQAIPVTSWVLSYDGRQRAELTDSQLQLFSLGKLGLFVRHGTVTCTTPLLSYLK